jgi:hypothetical protein
MARITALFAITSKLHAGVTFAKCFFAKLLGMVVVMLDHAMKYGIPWWTEQKKRTTTAPANWSQWSCQQKMMQMIPVS